MSKIEVTIRILQNEIQKTESYILHGKMRTKGYTLQEIAEWRDMLESQLIAIRNGTIDPENIQKIFLQAGNKVYENKKISAYFPHTFYLVSQIRVMPTSLFLQESIHDRLKHIKCPKNWPIEKKREVYSMLINSVKEVA